MAVAPAWAERVGLVNFEVHIEGSPDTDPRSELDEVPEHLRGAVSSAIVGLAAALADDDTWRVAVSGQVGGSERQADSVHVSVYRGAPVEDDSAADHPEAPSEVVDASPAE